MQADNIISFLLVLSAPPSSGNTCDVISSSIDIVRAGGIERGRKEEVVGMEVFVNSTEKETLPYYFKLL